jgi:multicomponent Na+:H+ antiporter subunit F
MHDIHVAALIAVLVGVLVVLPRAIRGPTLLDRILAVNVIGTKTIVLLALIGFLDVEFGIRAGAAEDYSRAGFFLDIALAYALINFIATIAVLRYIEARARRRDELAVGPEGGDA